MSGKRWVDDDDDDDSLSDVNNAVDTTKSTSAASGSSQIPKTHTSRVDSRGIKIVTSYRPKDDGSSGGDSSSLIKTVTKIRVTSYQIREHKNIARRRLWKKFGQAAVDEDQSNVTIQSREDIQLEDPNADTDLQDEDASKALAGNLNAFWAKQQRRQLERKYDVEEKDPSAVAGGGEADGWQKVGTKLAGVAGGGTKYVPPSARGAARGGASSLADMASRIGDKPPGAGDGTRDRDQNTIRVTNISEDTTEADLQELFGRFGRISRVYVAKDKETLQSRGFAFVSFTHREEAARAMEKLQGYGYDHLILKLEWARPSAPKDSGTQFRSGYGQALAQDTKAKVSYASNLTR